MRSFTKLYVTLTTDEDFNNLSVEAQWLYLRILADPALTHVGVAPYAPAKWRAWARPEPSRRVSTARSELLRARFIHVDEGHRELWVRSWMRYDDTFRIPNLMKAAAADYQLVASPGIRAAILDVVPSDFREGFAHGFREGFPVPKADNRQQQPTTATSNPLNTHTATTSKGRGDKRAAAPRRVCVSEGPSEVVASIWNRWPEAKRGDVGKVMAAWALTGIDAVEAEAVVASATRWLQFWEVEGIAVRYVPRLAKWLTERAWETPPPVSSANGAEARRNHARAELQAFIERGEA